jgi:uncharacterized membrane protein YkoI
MRHAYATPMKMLLLRAILATAPILAAVPVLAAAPDQRRGDQMSAFEARRQGRAMSLREIEARVIPTMKGAQYIGFDYDSGTAIYTLKFLRDGTVIWVDVDGRSGQIVGRTGR